MTAEHCPTCGATVRVVSSDEGTSHYEPVGDPRQAALDALTEQARRCRKPHFSTGDYPGRREIEAWNDGVASLEREAAAALRAYLPGDDLGTAWAEAALRELEAIDVLGDRLAIGRRVRAARAALRAVTAVVEADRD